MPYHRLEGLTVWCYVSRINRRDDDTRIRYLCRVSPVPPDDRGDATPSTPGILNGGDEIRAHTLFEVSSTHREDEEAVFAPKTAAAKPAVKYARPAFVVGAGRQLRDVIGWRIRLEARNLSEVVYCVRSVRGAAAHAENEKPPAARPGFGQQRDDVFDQRQYPAGPRSVSLRKETEL